MKNLFLVLFLLTYHHAAIGQTPVVMSAQPALHYLETFDSISNWDNNFLSGTGAAPFASVPVGGTNAIPEPLRITTSSAAWTTQSSGGLQKDTLYGQLMMLVTGTTNNTNSVAFDVFFDFSNIGTGTLSFDWKCIFNGATTSNRTGTLKVYASTNGTSFTELTGASITVTNYIPTSGTVSNIALPATFSNNANARLRFYYYNSAGGTTGSRPLIALNDLKVTASGVPCSTPSASATNLSFSNLTATSAQISFSAATPAPDEYLVVATPITTLVGDPVDSMVYNMGDPIADGTVIYRGNNTFFSASGLSPQTTYLVRVYSSNIYCNGVIRYKTVAPLSGQFTTPAGPPCVAPSSQPDSLIFENVTTQTIAASFSPVNDADAYLVIATTHTGLTAPPVNQTVYNMGDTVGGGSVVYRGGSNHFVAAGLQHSTTYTFFIYALNYYACSQGPVYQLLNPLSGQQSTKFIYPCSTPGGDASDLQFEKREDQIHGFFTPYAGNADGYLVVMSNSPSLSAMPVDTVVYTPGSVLGNGVLLSVGSNYSFSALHLLHNTTYYFFVFSYNDVCIGGPFYRTSSYLSGFAATTDSPANRYFFGNLHAHSSYSDGNKDQPTFTPTDDYSYARNAQCMDFLGISEHNHYTSSKNPGMLRPYYQLGLTEAANFTANNPGFLALYGMEWGTLTNGGHVVIYGIDSLLGWETINGAQNYDIFVAKNDYLSDSGLFRTVLQFAPQQAFATLAHPEWKDFSDLANQPWLSFVDSATVGAAVESGPAFSTNTTYSNPGSNFYFLPYYEHLLSKGYHIAPLIDHDNHYTTFGTTAYSRTAVIAPSIAKGDFMSAMNNRRFYATQDCDTRAQILVYNRQMGTEMSHSFAPAITVFADDPTLPNDTPFIQLYAGLTGSGATPAILRTHSGYCLNFTDHSLPDSSGAYYYAIITIGGHKTVTAPVWYLRLDTGIINASPEVPEFHTTNKLVIKNNPARETLYFDVFSNPKVHTGNICIINLMGQRVFTQKVFITDGKFSGMLPLANLLPGMYLLEFTLAGESMVKRFIYSP